MSLEEQRNRLESMSWDANLTEQQRRKARQGRDRLSDAQIQDAWDRISERSAEYELLVNKLTTVVDRIQANKLTNVTDDLNDILGQVTQC